LTDPGPEGYGSHARELTGFGNRVIFTAQDAELGSGGENSEPWITDGTPGGTAELRELSPGNTGSGPNSYTGFGGEMVFNAGDGIWATNGSAAGTELLVPGSQGSSFTPFGGTLYFSYRRDGVPGLYRLAESPPVLTLDSSRQRLDRALEVQAGCDENCEIIVKGKVVAKKRRSQARKFAVEATTVEVEANDTETVSVSMKRKDRKKARRILRRKGGKAKVRFIATATDLAGNRSDVVEAKSRLRG
jgi:ELWxxDGT repeat protein